MYVIMLLGCGLVGTDRTQGDHQFRLGLSGNSQRARQGQTQLTQHSPGKKIAQEKFAQEDVPNSAPTTWLFEKFAQEIRARKRAEICARCVHTSRNKKKKIAQKIRAKNRARNQAVFSARIQCKKIRTKKSRTKFAHENSCKKKRVRKHMSIFPQSTYSQRSQGSPRSQSTSQSRKASLPQDCSQKPSYPTMPMSSQATAQAGTCIGSILCSAKYSVAMLVSLP